MSESDRLLRLEEDIRIHVFTVSATLVGVCMTVIGIVRIVIVTKNISTLADDLLALDAFIFLCSCLSSYWALRTSSRQRAYQVERFADVIFIIGLVLMVVVCGIIVYVLV